MNSVARRPADDLDAGVVCPGSPAKTDTTLAQRGLVLPAGTVNASRRAGKRPAAKALVPWRRTPACRGFPAESCGDAIGEVISMILEHARRRTRVTTSVRLSGVRRRDFAHPMHRYTAPARASRSLTPMRQERHKGQVWATVRCRTV